MISRVEIFSDRSERNREHTSLARRFRAAQPYTSHPAQLSSLASECRRAQLASAGGVPGGWGGGTLFPRYVDYPLITLTR